MTEMTVLVVGGGGREHALAWALDASTSCGRLIVAPGNGGTPGTRIDIAVDDVDGLVAVCRDEQVDLAVIGPEAALAAGVADALRAVGVAVFGPDQDLARLESSKVFSRALADELGLAGPRSAAFGRGDVDSALAWIAEFAAPVVVKQSGLAAGKGVVVPEGPDETEAAVRAAIAIDDIVIEERLSGPECSLIALCDGTRAIALPIAQDHKRIGEGDTGPNTGGMGAYAPADVGVDADTLMALFITPVIEHLAAAGTPYIGALYAGVMMSEQGPRLLEFNCRFGDPEAQVLIPMIDGDLCEILAACAHGALDTVEVRIHPGASLAVVVAASGYPQHPDLGTPITALAEPGAKGHLFHAGTRREPDGRLVTSGGRVLACVGRGATLDEARQGAYEIVDDIAFEGMYWRRDIGWRAAARTLTSYADAGVDIDEGTRAVESLSASVARTANDLVLRGVGAFGGALDVSFLKEFDAPVLVGSTDGVGTKVELAARTRRLRGVGMDIVNHCIDDVLVQRARPLFFLDYLASSRLVASDVAEVVEGMSQACVAAGCVLLGGETAEMPGVYAPGAFDIAGTLVGVAERSELLPRRDLAPGDVLVGLASSGPHTNGYSFLRRLFAWIPLDAIPAPLERPLVDELLQPHRSYLDALTPALDTGVVKALVHITGGGLPENLPRVLPEGVGAQVELGSWPVPPLFRLVRELSVVDDVELHRTLNMGIGMVVIVAENDVETLRAAIPEPTWCIGRLEVGDGVTLS